MGDAIYPILTLQNVVTLAVVTYVITLLASLYPAVMAARMEPVEALHAQ
jgi:ABC-type lipoprotein release transport system permease subunit